MSNRSLIAFDDVNNHYRKVLCNSTGELKVETTSTLAAGASTLAEQQAQTSELTLIKTSTASLDSKVTACDTGAVVVSSSALPTGGSTLAEQQTQSASLSSIDGKITACDTGAVVVSSMPIIQGSNGGIATDVQVDSHGCVSVKVKELENSSTTAWNNSSIVASEVSSVVDVSAMTHTNIVIEDSDFSSTDTYTVEVSVDGVKYYHFSTLYPWDVTGSGTTRTDRAILELHGLTSLRVTNNGGAKSGVYLLVAGTP